MVDGDAAVNGDDRQTQCNERREGLWEELKREKPFIHLKTMEILITDEDVEVKTSRSSEKCKVIFKAAQSPDRYITIQMTIVKASQ